MAPLRESGWTGSLMARVTSMTQNIHQKGELSNTATFEVSGTSGIICHMDSIGSSVGRPKHVASMPAEVEDAPGGGTADGGW